MSKKDSIGKISEIILKAFKNVFLEMCPEASLPLISEDHLQEPKDKQFGDLTSNIAMRVARAIGAPPNVIADKISVHVSDMLTSVPEIDRVETKGGFVNIWFSEVHYANLLKDIKKKKERFASSDCGKGKKVNLEFVSANPTGPLTIAHGRQAAIGDALSRMLRFNGYDVTTEYYLNDFGRQINLLGKSVEVRYRNFFDKNEDMPEEGYMGEYITEIAEEIKQKKSDSLLEKGPATEEFFRKYAVDYMMELIHKDLEDFRVKFDVWTSQAKIEGRDKVSNILQKLEERGHIYKKDEATWFRSTSFKDDKDRVVIKSDGAYTYLAPDIAYHNDKYLRGYDWLIDLLGPDHHGYIKRMKAAVQALGHEAKTLDILIVQLVTLMRNGEVVSMSTRKGKFVRLREVMDEIGTDVTRFYFLMRKLDSHLDFDIELAKKESSDNPVFYVQYAHARICSILKHNEKEETNVSSKNADLKLLTEKQEKELMRKLGEFPIVVRSSAENLEPSKLITYLNELARSFHSFYTECRVVSEDAGRTSARLYLVECVKIVLVNGLGLLNITLPEKM